MDHDVMMSRRVSVDYAWKNMSTILSLVDFGFSVKGTDLAAMYYVVHRG